MKCPICTRDLTSNGDALACQPHGVLLSAEAFQKATGIDAKYTKRVTCPVCGTYLNSTISDKSPVSVCPTCRGVWLDDSEFEKKTGADPKTGFAVKWVTRKLVCPVCKKAMNTVMTRGVEIDFCEKCGGVWLDTKELELITGVDLSLGRRIACPSCASPMLPGIIHQVEIDICAKCSSVWLDNGEMELLTERVKDNTISVQSSSATGVSPAVEVVFRKLDTAEASVSGTIEKSAENRNVLDEIASANKEFLKAQTGKLKKHSGMPSRKLAIISCMDPRLTYLLERSLGFKRGDAFFIKNAGATMTSDDELLRSLAVALFASDIEEILVVGHTDCKMAKINSFTVTEAMKKRNVKKESIPVSDIRTWLGGFATEQDNIKSIVERLRKSPLIPANVPVHGLLLDIDTGKAEIIVNGYRRPAQNVSQNV